jgi:hypothetical protein
VREEQLLAKRFAKLADLREIRDKAAGTQRQLDARSAEGGAIAGRRAAVVAEFDMLVPPEDPFREPLNRVFLRWGVGWGSRLGYVRPCCGSV